MSEKLSIEFKVKKEIAKKVSLETGKFYYQSGTFKQNFSDLPKEVKEYVYDEIFYDGDVPTLRLDRLHFFYETIEKEPVKFEKFNFTSKFFEGEQINEFVLHYFQMQQKYKEIKSKPEPQPQTQTTSNRINSIAISYLLHPDYVEAKKLLGEGLPQKQQIYIHREDLLEDMFLSFVKHMAREKDGFHLDLTQFDPNKDDLFASSLISIEYNSTTLKKLLKNWLNHLEEKETIKPASDEKQTWITQFGSSHLKRAFRMNYNCQRQYVTERVAKEHPNFTLDFDHESKRKERPFPSEKALDAEEQIRKDNSSINVRVEWMQKPEKECEVVVIQDYLGKYLLYKKI